MSKKKSTCKCPPHLQQFCKHKIPKRVETIDVKEVIEALTYEELQQKLNKVKAGKKAKPVPVKFKTKPFQPRHYKDTCVPMKPSMHTRLRYITHCPPAETMGYDGKARSVEHTLLDNNKTEGSPSPCSPPPPPQPSPPEPTARARRALARSNRLALERDGASVALEEGSSYKTPNMSRNIYMSRDFGTSSDDSIIRVGGKSFKKRIRHYNLTPGDIHFPSPAPIVKHGVDDDTFIVNVGSPKTSGEVIRAQEAKVKPREWKPPLPAKSGHDLYKPHSGIIINRDKTFVPDVVHMPGKITKKPQKLKPCHKGGGVCKNKKCPRKKCRKMQAMRRKQLRLRGIGKGPGGKISKNLDLTKRSHARSQISQSVTSGATDGKPRAKGRNRHVKDVDSYCGLDEIPRPEHAFIPPNLKKGMMETHSLTVLPCTKEKNPIHYGILMGTINMYDSKFGARSRGKQALTMSVMAYCLAFHYHPKQWTAKLVDSLVDSGDVWYIQCLDKVHDHSAIQGICEVLPYGKKQTLVLNGKRMQVLLGEPDVIGYTMSKDPTVYNLCRGLVAFFKDNRAGVLLSRVLKVVIWKDKVCYYIFDPAGRDSRAYSNYANGGSALMNVADIKSVAEILLSRSVLDDQKYVLASLKVLRMVKETADEDFESDAELTQAEKAMLGYRILNENCAIVNANMHLGDRCFEEGKYRQGIPIAVTAITYAKISPPNTWFSKTLDKILRLGNKLYRDCVHPKVLIDLTIDNIPNVIMMGPYACEIIIYRERVKGQLFTPKECIFNIRTGLVDFFSHEYNSGILEFNNYSMAIWRQKEMFYFFDPYPRNNEGTRALKGGRACCWMLLNPEAMANVLIENFNYMPATTQFYIHAFKVLKLKKKQPKNALVCTLSDENIPKKVKRSVLHAAKSRGDSREVVHDVFPATSSASGFKVNKKTKAAEPKIDKTDEEQMGDIVSLVDSIQDDYVPAIPKKYKNLPPDELEEKIVNLDSPTVSVTQVVPPWPLPRDKRNEPPEPDPSPEPTPPPTPPPPVIPEGGIEEEEQVEEEEDEEQMQERLRKKKEAEEEARRIAEALPPPLPPPPSPQPEPLQELHPLEIPFHEPQEVEAAEPPQVPDRKVLLTEDAHRRFKLRALRKKMTAALFDESLPVTPSVELKQPHNFKTLPDESEIIRGSASINENDVLPFAAIMAVVVSYKYLINTWAKGIVDFGVTAGKQLYASKTERFQTSPVHIIPKIGIGKQAYHATIDVVGEGATWEMEEILTTKFFPKHDRGIITTTNYSCAIFTKNGLYYLFDACPCNAMGLRDDSKGMACFLRFRNLDDLIARILYNKDGKAEDQQFVVSNILVRKLLPLQRFVLPEDYDYDKMAPKSAKSKPTLVQPAKHAKDKKTTIDKVEPKMKPKIGYSLCDGTYKLEGTTSLGKRDGGGAGVKSCHFVGLMAMLMATMHPIRTWDHIMVDMCTEKGLEIFKKAANLTPCDKRVIKNVIVDGKFIDVNIKKIVVINNNAEKKLEQYISAVSRRLRYFMIKFPNCSVVVCHSDGYYHLFDPYESPKDAPDESASKHSKINLKHSKTDLKHSKTDLKQPKTEPTQPKTDHVPSGHYASWTLYRSQEALIKKLRKSGNSETPEFYTFELTSIKTAPRHSALNYRLSPLFKPDENPNALYLKPRRTRPLVNEKMYWLDIEFIPWSRMRPTNDLGFPRNTPRTLWREWDIEFPGDLYSLWGSVHPRDTKFDEKTRGTQYLATCVVAIVMSQACAFSAWTGSFLDGIVNAGDRYHQNCLAKVGGAQNHELQVTDLDTKFDDMFPYSFTAKFDNVLFGFVYNMLPDRFNLSKALDYFFETHNFGLLVCPSKNLAFGKSLQSYFMFDCTSFGAPVFCPGQGASYMLKCESLNRLVYCMTLTLDIKRHGTQFHLFSVDVTLSEKTK